MLSELDDARERAFADADPAQLGHVYSPGALLRQDAAALTRLVPGCRVVGLRTSYSRVVLLGRSAATVSVRATAALARAQVVCGSSVSGYTTAHSPVQMTIGLVGGADGYRISSLRVDA